MINKSLISLGISLIFLGILLNNGYKPANIKDELDKNKQVITKQDLINDINNLLSVNSRYSVYIHNLSTDDLIEINSTEKFQAASVTKVLVAVNALAKVDKSKMSNTYVLNRVSQMINQSNNNAWDVLNSMIGFDNLQKFAENNKIVGTNIYDNEMTAQGVGVLLEDIYEDKYISKSSKDFLLKQMTNTNNEKMLPASVDSNIIVYHKTGTYLGNIHDAGIVMHNTPYIIVIFTDDNKGTPTDLRMESIKNAAQRVYQYYTM